MRLGADFMRVFTEHCVLLLLFERGWREEARDAALAVARAVRVEAEEALGHVVAHAVHFRSNLRPKEARAQRQAYGRARGGAHTAMSAAAAHARRGAGGGSGLVNVEGARVRAQQRGHRLAVERFPEPGGNLCEQTGSRSGGQGRRNAGTEVDGWSTARLEDARKAVVEPAEAAV